MRITELVFRAVLLTAMMIGVVGCSKPGTPSTEPGLAAVKPEAAPTAPASPEPASSPSGSFTVAGVFPTGPGKEMVLSTCGSCHPVACTAIGQRTADRWESLKSGHRDKLTSVSAADLDTMFAYLKTTFNESKPEPKIPPEALQQGCTPF